MRTLEIPLTLQEMQSMARFAKKVLRISDALLPSLSVALHLFLSVCVQHSDGQCEHTLRLPDSFLACCALSDLRFSFVTMSLAQVKTTVRVSPIMVAELALPNPCRCLQILRRTVYSTDRMGGD